MSATLRASVVAAVPPAASIVPGGANSSGAAGFGDGIGRVGALRDLSGRRLLALLPALGAALRGDGPEGLSSSSSAGARAGAAGALADRFQGWVEAVLYDIAEIVVREQQMLQLQLQEEDRGKTAADSRGTAAGAGAGCSPPQVPLRQPPPTLPPPPGAVALALAALPGVMPAAASWAAQPAGPGRCVLAVLLEYLQPRLGELPGTLLAEMLRGLTDSGLHPGPRFLSRHALALKRRTEQLSPQQLVQAARDYRKLGMMTRGGLRAAIRAAREAIVRERELRRPYEGKVLYGAKH
ncbi:hypothetical protein GPECTOR_55g334 [Gonium pectorale]|uniref:Uncharacterized protein n=1 Tax=Gonium pectorale TaxID=33097 RepID=A0A150G6G6_GONPE|nr:hypothetical protein GPECTOR_55g334 [Gonium pectorale]|eukprot:KXZ45428.1 hypothetical protein GPECTOR_55g334 [Gonium pectorale]